LQRNTILTTPSSTSMGLHGCMLVSMNSACIFGT
jgi:hypothetical protein